jgi:hypothetical protein
VFERFTDRARRVVVLAQEEARLLNHSYIGTEHILLGLIHESDGVAANALRSLDISLEAVRARVEEIVGHGNQAPSGHIPFTPRAKKVLELSLREALELGHNYIGTEHILLGLIREGEGAAAQVLVSLGAERSQVRRVVIQLLSGYAGGVSSMRLAVSAVDPREARGLFRTASGAPALRCSFCGRDLWEVDHYVAGPGAYICDVCIAAARTALEAAPADTQQLALPPRAFGSLPPDDPGASEKIAYALNTVFGGELNEQAAVYMEDGEQLLPILRATAERFADIRVDEVLLERVRFSGAETASVSFVLVLNTAGRLSFVGTVTRVAERWAVSRATIADVLRTGGVTLPPPE